MKVYIKTDESNRVIEWSDTRLNNSCYEIEVVTSHEVLSNPTIFMYSEGKLVKDEAYQQELIEQAEQEASKPSEIEKLEQALMEIAIMVM